MSRSASVALGLILCGAWLVQAHAAPSLVVKPDDVVRGHAGLTYLDLVREAAPDLALNPSDGQIEGDLKTLPRDLDGGSDDDAPDPLVLGFMQARRVQVGGQPRIALIADLGQAPDNVASATVLLLFDDAPRPRLLDAAQVSSAEDTEFGDAPLRLGPGDDAVVVYNEHDDADLSLGSYMIVSLIGDRLGLIDRFPVSAERSCGWSDIERTTFSTAPDPGRPYRRIDVAVSADFKRTPDDCGSSPIPKGRSGVYRAAFRWSPAHRRYEPIFDGLKRLEAVDRAIFQ